LGIQFFQISNDGESWKTLQEFDNNLRKKYMLRRVRPLFDGFVDPNVEKKLFPPRQDMVDTEMCNHSEISAPRLAKLLLGPINKRWDGKTLPPDEPSSL